MVRTTEGKLRFGHLIRIILARKCSETLGSSRYAYHSNNNANHLESAFPPMWKVSLKHRISRKLRAKATIPNVGPCARIHLAAFKPAARGGYPYHLGSDTTVPRPA